MLAKFDENGDNEISFDEFLAMLCVEPWASLLPEGGAAAIKQVREASANIGGK